MEDKFNQNDFEEFLQDQVRNHRMYPADSVWREIDKKLHGEKRWPALTVAALMLLSATVLICVYFTPKPNIFSIKPANVNTSTSQPSQNNNILNSLATSTPFTQDKSKYSGSVQGNLPSNPQKVAASNYIDRTGNHLITPQVKHLASEKISIPTNHTNLNTSSASGNLTENTKSGNSLENADAAFSADVVINKKADEISKANSSGEISLPKDYNDKNMVDDFLKDHKNNIPLLTASKKISIKKRFSYQIYFAPSISYRKLLEDNSMVKANDGGPVGLNYVTDVNKVVRHKPGTGIEVGLSFMYHLSNSIRIKSGFQFNMRQYSIEAFRSNTELASIALMVGSNRIDTINTLSFYRNNNGYSAAKLVNRYYQLSAPIGLEWQIIGNKRIQFNVAGTIQPTYLLNRNAYLLSTNFKNYTESPGIVRQWNINSNIEAFMSFKVGDFKWQLGPQLRYQPYSTFIPEYSIKEHLMDYGLKLGVSKILN